MIEKIKKAKENIKIKKLEKIKNLQIRNDKDLENLEKIFLKEINDLKEKNKKTKIEIDDYKTFNEFKKEILNKQNNFQYYSFKILNYFKSKKRLYNIVMILNNYNINSFEIYEDTNVNGFFYKNSYYVIDRECIINQNEKSFLFYFENYSPPINFRKSFLRLDKEGEILNEFGEKVGVIEFNSRALKEVANGNAFKGIIGLGKMDKSNFNWLYIIIGLGIIVVFILQMTGQINLNEILGVK